VSELLDQFEDHVQDKLYSQLKEQLHIFEEDLCRQEENLELISITMHALKSKKPSEYQFLVDLLIEARARYVKLHFKETNTILLNLKDQSAKKVAILIAWLQDTVSSEGIIFEQLKISKSTYFDLVFESTLFQIIK
jgi:hypothetical protein